MIVITQQAKITRNDKGGSVDIMAEEIKKLNSQFKINGASVDGIEDMEFETKTYEEGTIISRKLYLASEKELQLLRNNTDKV